MITRHGLNALAVAITTLSALISAGGALQFPSVANEESTTARTPWADPEELATAVSLLHHVPTESVTVYGHAVTLAELLDFQRIAESDRISLKDAVVRYAWQSEFNEAAIALERDFPQQYAGASSAHYGPWIAFKGDVPALAARYVDELPVKVDLVGGRGFSRAELSKVLEEEYYDIYDHPLIENAVGKYNIETGQITIKALLDGAIDSRAERDILQAKLRPDRPANEAVTITWRIVDELTAGVESHLFGGGLITGCTAGFAVIHTSGDTGLATADHCADRLTVTYTNHNGGGSHDLSRRDRAGQTDDRDLAWYRGNNFHSAQNFFFHDWNSVREVTAISTPSVNNTLCHFGRTTGGGGDECAIVFTNGACGNGYCGLTMMASHITSGGDSGGPWFLGNTAYGIHHGQLFGVSAFTPVQGDLFQSMSVNVMTF